MNYTKLEEAEEFWMLTKGILQDSSVDTAEACVIRRWLTAHGHDAEFPLVMKRLEQFMKDGYIDRFESAELISTIGTILRDLRKASEQ